MADIGIWKLVPFRARALAKSAASMVSSLEETVDACGFGPTVFHLQPESNLAVISRGYWDKSADCKVCVIDPEDADPDGVYVMAKVAWPATSDVLGIPAHLAGWKPNTVTNALGGPSALTATVGSGLMGGLAGYGIGKLLQKGVGTAGRLWRRVNPFGLQLPWGHDDDEGEPKWPGVSTGLGILAGTLPAAWAAHRGWFGTPAAPVKAASAALASLIPVPDYMTKEADDTHEPFIKVDKFNQVIWEDDKTPVELRALAAGLVDGASAYRGDSSLVSPWDICRMAVGMGSGLVSGLLVGKTLGALAGMDERMQNDMQRTGVWAGLIRSVLPRALPR